MVFNDVVFNTISLLSQRPVHTHAFHELFKPFPAQHSFQATGCFPTKDSGEGGMNPVDMTIIKPQIEY